MTTPMPRTNLARWAPLPPLVLVNAVAFYGQYAWAEANLPPVTVLGRTFPLWAVLFAAALESIAIYLSYEAHKARMAGDSSGKLWAAAYGVALLAGGLNYWHLADPVTHQPTPAAVAFGVMSLLSPWLWGVRSRSLNRDQLRTLGLIEPRAVKFSTARWVLFPGPTFRAFRAAVWAGETNPLAAIALIEPKPNVDAATPTSVGVERAESKHEPRKLESPVPPRRGVVAPVKPKAAPSREQARAILMALKDFEAVSNAELARVHGGSDRFWGGAKDRLRGELADLTEEARTL